MTQLIKTENQDQFLLALNQATGFSGSLPMIPHLKFNGETGNWEMETDKKDDQGKPVYEVIGEQVEMHIITTRKMVQSSFSSQEGFYSREFQFDDVELFDKEKKMVMKGSYKALKYANPNLVYIQVLYAFVNNKLYRIKLSGSKLTKLFPYMSSFKNDNPAIWYTVAKKGKQEQKGAVKYYELEFSRGDQILDQQLIIDRVNGVNEYLKVYIKQRDEKVQDFEPEPEIITNDLPNF